MKWKEEKI
jgi:hypothetical protein